MGHDTYASRQSVRDQEYARSYQSYIEGLPPAVREQYLAAGVGRPKIEGKARNVGVDGDLSKFARTEDHHDEDEPIRIPVTITATSTMLADSNGHALPPVTREPMVEQVQIIASIFISSQNLKMEAVALAFATGLGICSLWGGIQAQAARKLNLPRQNLNKSIKRWQRMLELPPNNFTHSPKVSKKLSEAQREKHWRRAKYKMESA